MHFPPAVLLVDVLDAYSLDSSLPLSPPARGSVGAEPSPVWVRVWWWPPPPVWDGKPPVGTGMPPVPVGMGPPVGKTPVGTLPDGTSPDGKMPEGALSGKVSRIQYGMGRSWPV